MTPDQQAALESLADRVLTEAESALAESRNDAALAASLSVGRTRVQSKEIGTGTILATLAPDGGAFLDGLSALGEADRNVFWALDLIKQGRFDIGMPAARAQVQALATANAGIADAVTALLALAEIANPIPTAQVSAILNGDPA